MEDNKSKKRKVGNDESVALKGKPLPSSIIVNFLDSEGVRAGPPMELPTSTSLKQLEILVNSLLGHEYEEKNIVPYAFYINGIEVEESLEVTVSKDDNLQQQSFEEAITISYQPLSVFKVRPVTRCVESLTGHSEAILHVSYSPDGEFIHDQFVS